MYGPLYSIDSSTHTRAYQKMRANVHVHWSYDPSSPMPQKLFQLGEELTPKVSLPDNHVLSELITTHCISAPCNEADSGQARLEFHPGPVMPHFAMAHSPMNHITRREG
ncbi:hypothetical protein V3C99_013049 [Haemonchus contortus]|uniref:DUF1996 domain-containing protein n=1 Tax=Haemonchus contortus TaxID=6289 RepID=A0A7I4Y3M7_HAECO